MEKENLAQRMVEKRDEKLISHAIEHFKHTSNFQEKVKCAGMLAGLSQGRDMPRHPFIEKQLQNPETNASMQMVLAETNQIEQHVYHQPEFKQQFDRNRDAAYYTLQSGHSINNEEIARTTHEYVHASKKAEALEKTGLTEEMMYKAAVQKRDASLQRLEGMSQALDQPTEVYRLSQQAEHSANMKHQEIEQRVPFPAVEQEKKNFFRYEFQKNKQFEMDVNKLFQEASKTKKTGISI